MNIKIDTETKLSYINYDDFIRSLKKFLYTHELFDEKLTIEMTEETALLLMPTVLMEAGEHSFMGIDHKITKK